MGGEPIQRRTEHDEQHSHDQNREKNHEQSDMPRNSSQLAALEVVGLIESAQVPMLLDA